MQKNEQKQAAVQKQELVHKQMANIMDKFVKRIDKPSQVVRFAFAFLLIEHFSCRKKRKLRFQIVIKFLNDVQTHSIN